MAAYAAAVDTDWRQPDQSVESLYSTWASLSAMHVLAAHHQTSPQYSLLCISMPFSFHDGLSGKVSEAGKARA